MKKVEVRINFSPAKVIVEIENGDYSYAIEKAEYIAREDLSIDECLLFDVETGEEIIL